MSVIEFAFYIVLTPGACGVGMFAAYRWGRRDAIDQMHWAHFDKGCYLDENGEIYEHLKDTVEL